MIVSHNRRAWFNNMFIEKSALDKKRFILILLFMEETLDFDQKDSHL